MNAETSFLESEAEYVARLEKTYRKKPVGEVLGDFWELCTRSNQLTQRQHLREDVLLRLIQEVYEQDQLQLEEYKINLEKKLRNCSNPQVYKKLQGKIEWFKYYFPYQESLISLHNTEESGVYKLGESLYSLLEDFIIYTMKWAGIVFFEDTERQQIRSVINNVCKSSWRLNSAEQNRKDCICIMNMYAHSYALRKTPAQLEQEFRRFVDVHPLVKQAK